MEVKPVKPLGNMRVSVDDAKLALRLLVEGNSVRGTSRITGLDKATLLKLTVLFGDACNRFMDREMRGLKLTHLEFDEQWSWVGRKQARLTMTERAESSDVGDVYIWTCIDKETKLMPAFMLGKRSADNARRFMMNVASRIVLPKPHESDDQSYTKPGYKAVVQVSTDGFQGYPEAVDLAFGHFNPSPNVGGWLCASGLKHASESGTGTVTYSGVLNWGHVTMSGSGTTIISNTGTLNMSGSGGIFHTLSRVLQNDGLVNWTGGSE